MARNKKLEDEVVTAIKQRSAVPDTKQHDENTMPGPVIPRASIRLHTYIGHQLFFGRQDSKERPYREPSFTSYASNLNALWTCSQADDPYADARLIQIEDQINKVREMVSSLLKTLEGLLESLESSGIQAVSHQSIRPVDVPISFRTVHAAVSVQLLGMVDQVIQKALMARHFGMVTEQDWQRVLQQSVSPMRHLFTLSQFRASGATRDDFASNNARAQAALEKQGHLPTDVLQGLRRPLLGPRQRKSVLFAERNDGTQPGDDSLVGESLKALKHTENASASLVTK